MENYRRGDILLFQPGDGFAWRRSRVEMGVQFEKTWGLHQLNFKDFDRLYRRIENDSAARAHWSNLYSVSHAEGNNITRQTFGWLFCATGNVMEADYRACLERLDRRPQISR